VDVKRRASLSGAIIIMTARRCTMVDVIEKDAEGNMICCGCKQPLNINKSYVQRKEADDGAVVFYHVHKYCSVNEVYKP
jgi:hypothetical protein